MRNKVRNESVLCAAYEAINLLQEKWVLHIIRTLLDKPFGFNELSRAVGGVNAATLAQRLDLLENIGIVKKTVHSVMPPRTSYQLTPTGVELQGVVEAIDRWARAHLTQVRPSLEESPPAKTPGHRTGTAPAFRRADGRRRGTSGVRV
jgi:DNA-binding HxlR family transcriptional regulator